MTRRLARMVRIRTQTNARAHTFHATAVVVVVEVVTAAVVVVVVDEL